LLLLVGLIFRGSTALDGFADHLPMSIRVSDVTLFGDMECLSIETPGATYVYGKRGAGFVAFSIQRVMTGSAIVMAAKH
jgi:hypothetical protein